MDVEYAFTKTKAKTLWKAIGTERKARLQLEKALQRTVSKMLDRDDTPISCPKTGTSWTDPVTEKDYRVWWDYNDGTETLTVTNLQEEG